MLESVKRDVIMCFQAWWNQVLLRGQGLDIPVRNNWPEPDKRRTIDKNTWEQLKTWFLSENGFEHDCVEARHYCPRQDKWRYEAASSGTGNADGVHDLKITDVIHNYVSFNYHIQIVP
jgi:hypothetical protein